jgi:isochorismate synthase
LNGARLWLPQRLDWRPADGRGWTIHAIAVTGSDEPAAAAVRLLAPPAPLASEPSPPWPGLRNDYIDQVDDAVVLLRDGAMRKVVLARAVDEPLSPNFSESVLLTRLHALGGGTLYAHDVAGSLFCGSTPEVLFSAHGDAVDTMALAGSTPRGPDAIGDTRQVDTLMQCTKQRKEHGLVVEHLVAGLRPRCAPFTVPDAPHPRLLERIIHLETRLAARLTRSDYLELLGALQPTPAVCGLPVATAAHYLARHERLHRGLYAGTLGWLTPDACRFVVPLRGGLIDRARGRARLFAGAGLVETSVAAEEFAETELKLSVMRQALTATG